MNESTDVLSKVIASPAVINIFLDYGSNEATLSVV